MIIVSLEILGSFLARLAADEPSGLLRLKQRSQLNHLRTYELYAHSLFYNLAF